LVKLVSISDDYYAVLRASKHPRGVVDNHL
jgi:hypothetical protein